MKNGGPMSKRRRFTAEEKVQILREHLENKISISELAKLCGGHVLVDLSSLDSRSVGNVFSFSIFHNFQLK